MNHTITATFAGPDFPPVGFGASVPLAERGATGIFSPRKLGPAGELRRQGNLKRSESGRTVGMCQIIRKICLSQEYDYKKKKREKKRSREVSSIEQKMKMMLTPPDLKFFLKKQGNGWVPSKLAS